MKVLFLFFDFFFFLDSDFFSSSSEDSELELLELEDDFVRFLDRLLFLVFVIRFGLTDLDRERFLYFLADFLEGDLDLEGDRLFGEIERLRDREYRL